jgi:hypothetical protein
MSRTSPECPKGILECPQTHSIEVAGLDFMLSGLDSVRPGLDIMPAGHEFTPFGATIDVADVDLPETARRNRRRGHRPDA